MKKCGLILSSSAEQLEIEMENAGVKSQWRKRIVLARQLQPDMIPDLKDLLSKTKAQSEATAYLEMKKRMLQSYGKKRHELYKMARDLPLTGKPSQHCKKLINLLCPKHPDLM